jgi:hypothetical protein
VDKKTTDDNILKCGKRTYFFDVKEASNGNTYLRVTESRFVKEGEERKRNSITLFKNEIPLFADQIKKYEKSLKNILPPKETREKEA